MTHARKHLVPDDTALTVHCVQRCVRRAFLCGVDRYSGQSFVHRKDWVEQRLLHLSAQFGVSLHGYAVMSNHLHVVLRIEPCVVERWSDDEIAERWVNVFPSRTGEATDDAAKRERLLGRPEQLTTCRRRLASLSWFMRCLAEPLARRANREDSCKGRFWEGRYKCQRLLDDRAILAAMAYVDLNPVRAGMTDRLGTDDFTSAALRLASVEKAPEQLHEPLRPIAGVMTAHCLPLTTAAYLQLLDWTGRQVHPGKRGKISEKATPALRSLGIDAGRWPMEVKGVGSGYWRAVGSATDLLALATALGQQWLKGIGFARALARG